MKQLIKMQQMCLYDLRLLTRLEFYPLCNASWVGGKASFGANFTWNRSLNVKILVHTSHLCRRAWKTQLVPQTMFLVSKV